LGRLEIRVVFLSYVPNSADFYSSSSIARLFTMSTFYLLPSRSSLEEYLAEALKPLLPCVASQPSPLLEILESTVLLHPDVFVIYRDELPEVEDLDRLLQDGFGAEPGDEVIEVRPGKTRRDWTNRRWRVADAA